MEIHPLNPRRRWIARAVENNFYESLRQSSRLRPVYPRDLDPGECPERSKGSARPEISQEMDSCRSERFYKAGVSISFSGYLRGNTVMFRLYDQKKMRELKTGKINLRQSKSLTELRVTLNKAIQPVIMKGGLLDQLEERKKNRTKELQHQEQIKEPGHRPEEPEGEQGGIFARQRDRLYLLVNAHQAQFRLFPVIALFFLTLLPLLLLKISGRKSGKKCQRNRSGILFLSLLLSLTGLLLFPDKAGFYLQKLKNLHQLPDWLMPVPGLFISLLGGVVCGYLVFVLARNTVPVIHGFEKLEHRMITLVLRAWSFLTVLRFIFLLPLVLGFFMMVYFSQMVLEFSSFVFYGVFLPLSGLTLCAFLSCLFEEMAKIVDADRVYGPAVEENPWHPCLMGYLREYFKRAGCRGEPAFLRKILFLPHRGDATDSWGGGLSRPRVAVSRKILSFALNIPEQAPARVTDKEKVPVEFTDEIRHVDDIVLPEPQDTSGKLEYKKNRKILTDYMKLEDFQKIISFKPFEVETEGQTGLAVHGEKMPDAPDEKKQIGLKEDRVYQVKEEVDANFTIELDSLTDDYRDFLFGLLLTEIGNVLRKGSHLDTMVLLMARINRHLPGIAKKPLEAMFAYYHRTFAKFSFLLSDSIAHVYGGEPHLLQYLYFIESGEEEILTRNATPEILTGVSKRILAKTEAFTKDLKDPRKELSLLRRRLLWLKGYFYSFEARERQLNTMTGILKLGLFLTVFGFISFKIWESLKYSSIYEKRMTEQRENIEKKAEKTSPL